MCDLYAQEMGIDWVLEKTGNYSILGHKHFIPPEVAKWAGLRRNTCLPILVDGEKKLLVDVGDMEEKADFDQIADIITKCF